MGFDWFRMWVDAVDDEKLKLLAFEDRWHFVAILCCKRKGMLDVPDTAAMRDRKVGAKLGLADRERDEVRRRLMDVDLVDENWQPLAWGKRQFISDVDLTATERKRRQRLKSGHGPVTRDKRDCHAPVTDESLSGHAAQTQTQTQTTDSDKNLRPPGVVEPKRSTAGSQQVFEHWKKTWGHPSAVFDVKRRKRIEARLKDFTPDQLCDAISGFRNSPWHCGTDPKGAGKVYDAIDTLLRDTGQVEEGIRLLAHPPRPPPKAETAMDRFRRLNSDPQDRVIEHESEQQRAITGY